MTDNVPPVAPGLDPREAQSFPQLIRAVARAYGDRPAIILRSGSGPDQTISFADMERRSAELARGMIARGVGKGSRVGLMIGNGPLFGVAFAAICRIGAIAIPISTLIRSNELIRVLRQSDVGGLIVEHDVMGHDMIARLCEALPDLAASASPDLRIGAVPFLRWIACEGGEAPGSIQPLSFLGDAAATVSEALLQQVEANVHPTDQMIEIYTSGSMALPKGVRHNHGPSLARIHYLADVATYRTGDERPIGLPMFWIGGLGFLFLPQFSRGVTSVCNEKAATNSRRALGSVLAAEDLQAPSPEEKIWAIGMTETFGPYDYSDVLRVPGYPLTSPLDHFAPGFEVRLWADGHEAAEGERGEIQVRGHALTPGLHKVERDKYFEPDGFYRTGDMAVREGGRIHFVGRAGDMIKSASANVSPAEVEMELQEMEGVHSAYVVGIPDKERGLLVVAAVVPRDGCDLDFVSIEKRLRKRLSGFKVPRHFVAIGRDEVPMLVTNKVSRRDIERMMIEKLGRKEVSA